MTSCIRIVLALLALAVSAAPSAAQSLIVCGWDEVFVLDVSSTPRKVWSWKALDRPELPPAYRTKFRTTDDCKPVSGGRVLITASSDGAALVERATGRTIWWGACGNAHSAELLPGDRIVLACSTREGTGNKLSLFDASKPERELFATELFSGHGVVWDEARARLWALGEKELRSYRLEAWQTDRPSLVLDRRYPLPDVGGHELTAVPRSAHLIVTTHAGVWRFDRDTHRFSPGSGSARPARREERRHRRCHGSPGVHAGGAARMVDQPHPFPAPRRGRASRGRAPLQGAVGW